MIQPRPRVWPQEYWIDEVSGQQRPICRCDNPKCSLAIRQLAYTYLDVKYPRIICGECKVEFEYLPEDCTNPHVSFSPPIGDQSSKGGKGKAKGKGFANETYGGGDKGKGKGKSPSASIKGKGKGYNGAAAGDIDIMAVLLQFGAGILTDDQVNKMKAAMKISPVPLKPKSQIQEAKAEYQAAMAELSGAQNKLKQSKENLIAMDVKFKAQLVTMCNHTQSCTLLKQAALDSKAKLDKLIDSQHTDIDEQVEQIAHEHSNAMIQIEAADDEDDQFDANHPDDHDPFARGDAAEQPEQEEEQGSNDTEMQQVAIKRHTPDVPDLGLSTNPSTPEIMGCFSVLNSAKKAKSTPRGDGDGVGDDAE